jgi:hypothetical protein
VLVGTALLLVVTVPLAASKLESVWSSGFTFTPATYDQVCVPSGICFQFVGDRLERMPTGYALPIRMSRVTNLYEVARDVDAGRLGARLEGAASGQALALEPHYGVYFNWDEAAREASASLRFRGPPPQGPFRVVFEHAGRASPSRTVNIVHHHVGPLETFVMRAERPSTVRLGAALALLSIAAASTWAEAGGARRLGLGPAAFAGAIVLRVAAIVAAGALGPATAYLAVVLGVLVPWLALTALAWRSETATPPRRSRLREGAATLIDPLRHLERGSARASIAELLVLASGLGVFASMLWFGESFRWGLFEERDFLEARRVLAERIVPLYGPELLLGGHTIGGGLYLLLAPAVALWNDPAVLLLLNRLLFLGMAVVLWWGTRAWVGPAGALVAVFVLVGSDRVLNLSYSPIHPNFSLFFAFAYAGALIRGAVDGRRGWLMASGLLLGGLVQLHFSYALLVIPHVLVVLLANDARDRWTKPLAAAAFLLPLAPFLVVDGLDGFPNIARIAQRPRLHPSYPDKILGNADVLPLVLGWLQQITGPFSVGSWVLTLLLVGLGIAAGIASKGVRRAPTTPALAATLLFALPALELTILGMGYNTRHTLAMVPALFILVAIGAAGAVALFRLSAPRLAPLVILPLVVGLALRASDSAVIGKTIVFEREWAVDYRAREDIATDLATRLGLSPEAYRSRTYWWWVGWSIDPAIYADIHRRVVGSAAAPRSSPRPDQWVLVTERAELPAFLAAIFDDEGSHRVRGMHVHVAKPRTGASSAVPSSNADTGVRLHPFLEDVDALRRPPPGVVRIGGAQAGEARRSLFLGTTAEGRIKLLITLERSRVGARGRLRWCIDSPSLNGHYQEIKTLWRPRLVLSPADETALEPGRPGDVLGSLAFKAPRCGEAWSEAPDPWRVALVFDGLFDQSFMRRPELLRRRWRLDPEAPLHGTSLSPRAIARWIDTRFDR